jgi:hypothetical protein
MSKKDNPSYRAHATYQLRHNLEQAREQHLASLNPEIAPETPLPSAPTINTVLQSNVIYKAPPLPPPITIKEN